MFLRYVDWTNNQIILCFFFSDEFDLSASNLMRTEKLIWIENQSCLTFAVTYKDHVV